MKLALLATAAALALAPPAGATFPGGNGSIAFVSTRAAGGDAEIFAMTAHGAGETRLTASPGDDFGPVWSPGGRLIAFYSNRDSPDPLAYDLYVMNADGSGARRVTTDPADDREPAWTGDGRRLVFVSNRSGNYEVYSVRLDGSALKRLTRTAADEAVPDVAYRTKRIVYARGGGIWVMNGDGSGQRRIARAAGAVAWNPSWSPGGGRIAFEWDRDTGEVRPTTEIWTMDADGGARRRLTVNRVDDGQPAWAPDGTRIAFVSDRTGFDNLYTLRAGGGGLARLTETSSGFAPGDFMPDWRRLLPR